MNKETVTSFHLRLQVKMGKYVRKTNRGSWSQEDLVNAMQTVTENKVPVREAARTFHIPERTLRRRLVTNNVSKGSLGREAYLVLQ